MHHKRLYNTWEYDLKSGFTIAGGQHADQTKRARGASRAGTKWTAVSVGGCLPWRRRALEDIIPQDRKWSMPPGLGPASPQIRLIGLIQESLYSNGRPCGTRTRDPKIKSLVLYQLS